MQVKWYATFSCGEYFLMRIVIIFDIDLSNPTPVNWALKFMAVLDFFSIPLVGAGSL